MPAEAYKLSHESINRVIYNSAGLTSFKEEKQMSAMHGSDKTHRERAFCWNTQPPSAVHMLSYSYSYTVKVLHFIWKANWFSLSFCNLIGYTKANAQAFKTIVQQHRLTKDMSLFFRGNGVTAFSSSDQYLYVQVYQSWNMHALLFNKEIFIYKNTIYWFWIVEIFW